MNLFELQERLKDFSQDQLVREMQAPTGTAPQYLVLSELQRRQRMMREQQAQMPQDQTTVAQDAVAAAGVPQGGLADMAQAMAPRTDMDMNTGVAPVERMQQGGLAGISRDVRDFAPRFQEEILGLSREDFSLLTPEEQLDILQFEDPTAGMRARGAEVFPEYDYQPTGQGFLIETLAPGAAEDIRQRNAAVRSAEEAIAEPDEAETPSDEATDLPEIVFDSEPGLSFGDQFEPVDVRRAGDEALGFGGITPTEAAIPLALPRGMEEEQELEAPRSGGAGGSAAVPATDDAFNQDKWLALAQVGLSLMSSQQPTLGGAIGEAGLSGITALRTAREERDARATAAQTRADRLSAAASRDESEAYPYREVDDIIGMADSYAQAAAGIVEANFGAPPVEGDPNYEQYINSLAMANVLRRRALALTGLE